jgi:hypothetical protein
MSPHNLISRLGLPSRFPEFFPPQLELYRLSLAEAADTPDDFAIGYMLAAAATAVGGDVSACVHPGWCIRCNVFVAVIAPKGTGKSVLAEKCLAPLLQREDELRDEIARPPVGCTTTDSDEDGDDGRGYDDGYGDDEDEDDNFCDAAPSRRGGTEQPDPCVVINDTTGPALLQLLERNPRQLLAHTDELGAMFIRNSGGTDRAMWCELFDGRRRRRARVSTKSAAATLAAPYVNVVGSIQPDLVKLFYSARGDDGLLDRLLLLGDGVARDAQWPKDADDPVLNSAWSKALARLLRIEEDAEDAINRQVESRFTQSAVEVCKGLLDRLNSLMVVLAVPMSQRGVTKKLIQHAVKLALLHRVLRWAAGEFGDKGPVGHVDADDAVAACEATLFFFGRWLIWRKELRAGTSRIEDSRFGLAGAVGDDPVLQSLAGTAAGALNGIRLIERIVRYARLRQGDPLSLPMLAEREPFKDSGVEEIRAACNWLAQHRHGEWCEKQPGTFRLIGTHAEAPACPSVASASAGGLS